MPNGSYKAYSFIILVLERSISLSIHYIQTATFLSGGVYLTSFSYMQIDFLVITFLSLFIIYKPHDSCPDLLLFHLSFHIYKLSFCCIKPFTIFLPFHKYKPRFSCPDILLILTYSIYTNCVFAVRKTLF